MLFYKYYIILFVFILLNTTDIFSDISVARIEYEKGNINESLEFYNEWLELNHESKDFTAVLFELSELNGDIFTITKILNEQIKFVRNREKKKELLESIAQLYELSSNLHNAQINYQNAALSMLNEIDYKMLLKSAELLLLEGNLFLAESQFKEIISNSSDTDILFEAELFYIILNIVNAHENKNISISSMENPKYLYIAYLIAKSNSEQVTMDRIKMEIINNFESSPEAGLLKNRIRELPDILTSLGLIDPIDNISSPENVLQVNTPESNKNFMIQTGSFKDKENAHYLSKDIISAGFISVVEEQIINNIKYYKVLLYFTTEEQMTNTLKALKEKGFEGFPVY